MRRGLGCLFKMQQRNGNEMAFIFQSKRAVMKLRIKQSAHRKHAHGIDNDSRAISIADDLRQRPDEWLKFLGNCSLAAGVGMYTSTSPSLADVVLNAAPLTSADFMMAAGLLIHLALKVGAWWESGDFAP